MLYCSTVLCPCVQLPPFLYIYWIILGLLRKILANGPMHWQEKVTLPRLDNLEILGFY